MINKLKKVFFFDIETYEKYDGTNGEMIKNSMIPSLKVRENFEQNKKIGKLYPVLLGNKTFTLGGLSQWGRQNKWFFEDRLEMKKKMLALTTQAIKEGRNAVFYVHNGEFDIPRIFKEEYLEFDLINKYSGSKIWIITPKIQLNLKCKNCKNEWIFECGKGIDRTKCPKCGENKKIPCGTIRDTMNFLGRNDTKALSEIGRELGIEKLETPLEITKPEELKEYLTRDLEITEKFIESFYNMNKIINKELGIGKEGKE